MATIFYRDRDESAAQRDMLDCIAGTAWGAIKSWQRAKGRPQMTAADVREAADEWLRSMHRKEIEGDPVDIGVAAVLAALNRADAKNCL